MKIKDYIFGTNRVTLFDTFIEVILDNTIVFVTTYETANCLHPIDLINLVKDEYENYVEDIYNSFVA